MDGPANYMLNLPNPAAAITSGVEQGMQLGLMAERGDLMKAQQAQALAQRQQTLLENQALQEKAQRERAQRDALDAFYKKPAEQRTAADYEAISATLPKEMAESVRASFESRTKEEQRQRLLTGGQVFAALRSGDRETANTILRQQADAARNAGDEASAKAFENAAEMAAIAPDQAELFVGTQLAVLPGGKDFIENVSKQSEMRTKEALAPAQIAKAVAEGKTAEIVANTEQKMRDAEIALKGAQTTSAKASAGASYASAKKTLREIQRIDALEPGEVRKLAAEAGKLEAEADKVRGAGDGTAAAETATRVRSVANRVTGEPEALAGITGPRLGLTPRAMMSAKQSDIASDIDFLKSAQFLSQVQSMRGLGQLSDKEGAKLENAIANLDRQQSPGRLSENIELIAKTIETAALRASKTNGAAQSAKAQPTAEAFPFGEPPAGAVRKVR